MVGNLESETVDWWECLLVAGMVVEKGFDWDYRKVVLMDLQLVLNLVVYSAVYWVELMAFPRVGKLAGKMVAVMASLMVLWLVEYLVDMMDNLLEEQMVRLSGF